MIASVDTSNAGDGADLIGLISSFLGPSISDSDAPQSMSLASTSGAPSSSNSADNITTEDIVCVEQDCTLPPARVVVFTKDRPWQLKQLLRSMKLRNKNTHHKYLGQTIDIRIILCASTPAFAQGYEQMMQEFDGMNVLIEDDHTEAKSFSCLLESALKEDTCKDTDNGIVMFLTDDCLLLEPLEVILAQGTGALQYGPRNSSSDCSRREYAFNFLTRLHPGMSWCQTRGVASPPPRDEMKFHSLAQYFSKLYEGEHIDASNFLYDGVHLYNRKRSSGEWAYPFDLSGGVYRHCDVITLLNHMGEDEKNHPNIFEMSGNQLLKAASENNTGDEHHLDELLKPLSAIPSRPMLVILAVNRVQDVFQAPLTLPREGKLDGACKGNTDDGNCAIDPSSPESLLSLLDEGCHLDVERYKRTIYNSSHIGDWFMKFDKKTLPGEEIDSEKVELVSHLICPKVSVLMPVHCGPPDAASHSIISIMMQPIDEFHQMDKDGSSLGNDQYQNKLLLSPMQIVLVDDRCSDGSIDAMIKSCEDLAQAYRAVSFTLQDYRFAGVPRKKELDTEDQRISISLDIVEAPRAGVACALNHGLGYCRAELVARMDADDIAASHRLLSQVNFMLGNPSFDVVGTSTILFSSRPNGKQHNQCSILPYNDLAQNEESCCVLRPSLSISDPGFMAWAMFFTCAISHPSVIFRKNTIQELGGYDESISRCEDYALWMRVLERNYRSIVCLPLLGLWHRKHDQSSSCVGSVTQKDEADKACYSAIEQMFHSTKDGDSLALDQASVSTLRDPSSSRSPESLNLAAKLLQRLEIYFLQKNSRDLTQQEIALIQLDCNERIGELATIFITKFGNKAKIQANDKDGRCTSFAWKLWCERCPDRQLERLSLLCHTNRGKMVAAYSPIHAPD